jgi:hypothetical protein
MMVIGTGAMAEALWNDGDGHVMTHPQLPKVDGGWDVFSQYYVSLADDWVASESGYVNDIHTWISFKDDVEFEFNNIHLAIWADDPINGTPLGTDLATEALWHGDVDLSTVDPEKYQRTLVDSGNQGWFNPRDGSYIENDHINVYQLDFLIDDSDAFQQVAGTKYWLEFAIQSPHEFDTSGRVGWKESAAEPFGDGAVWRQNPNGSTWNTILDPLTDNPMDLAFVITPEPTTVSMVALVGGLAVFIRRRIIG